MNEYGYRRSSGGGGWAWLVGFLIFALIGGGFLLAKSEMSDPSRAEGEAAKLNAEAETIRAQNLYEQRKRDIELQEAAQKAADEQREREIALQLAEQKAEIELKALQARQAAQSVLLRVWAIVGPIAGCVLLLFIVAAATLRWVKKPQLTRGEQTLTETRRGGRQAGARISPVHERQKPQQARPHRPGSLNPGLARGYGDHVGAFGVASSPEPVLLDRKALSCTSGSAQASICGSTEVSSPIRRSEISAFHIDYKGCLAFCADFVPFGDRGLPLSLDYAQPDSGRKYYPDGILPLVAKAYLSVLRRARLITEGTNEYPGWILRRDIRSLDDTTRRISRQAFERIVQEYPQPDFSDVKAFLEQGDYDLMEPAVPIEMVPASC